jgi:hypothetical protein
MNGKETFNHINCYIIYCIHKVTFLILFLTIIVHPQQDTTQSKLPLEHLCPETGIHIGSQVLKAGLITAIVGSVFLTMSALVLFTEPSNSNTCSGPGCHSYPNTGGFFYGGIGFIGLGLSIPLTISGTVIKIRFKTMKYKAKNFEIESAL